MTKICSTCRETKPKAEFSRNRRTKDGLRSQCKVCQSIASSKYRSDNPEKCRESSAKHYAKNRENLLAAGVKYNANNKEKRSIRAKERRLSDIDGARKKDAEKYAANPDRQKAASKRYEEKNPGISQRRAVTYRLDNPEKAKASTKAWQGSNKAACKVLRANRRARVLEADGTHTATDIDRLMVLQKGKCACCKTGIKDKYHVDHHMPLARGGSNWPSNLQLLCPTCNMQKSAKHPIDFMRQKGFLL